MFGITDIVTYLIGTILVIILPGPNSLYCLSVAASHGIKSGYKAAFGIIAGDSILIILTVLGAGTLLRVYPSLFNGIKLIGGLYLFYLGMKLVMGAYETYRNRGLVIKDTDAEQSDIKQRKDKKSSKQNYFIRAILLSLTNPKAILFFLAFFVQFVDPNYPSPLVTFLALAAILQVISFTYLNIMVLAGERLATRFHQYPWLVVTSMSLVGLLFIGFAVSLWLAQLT